MSKLTLKIYNAAIDLNTARRRIVATVPEVDDAIAKRNMLYATYHSTGIEGNTATIGDTEQILEGLDPYEAEIEDKWQVAAHLAGYKFVRDTAKVGPGTIDKDYILAIHKKVYEVHDSQVKGKYRTVPVEFGNPDFTPPAYEKVPGMMDIFINTWNEWLFEDPVEKAVLMHYNFESIHPFADANGRAGRLLVNHIFWSEGMPVMHFNREKEERGEYICSLAEAQRTGECSRLERYFERRYMLDAIETYRECNALGEGHDLEAMAKMYGVTYDTLQKASKAGTLITWKEPGKTRIQTSTEMANIFIERTKMEKFRGAGEEFQVASVDTSRGQYQLRRKGGGFSLPMAYFRCQGLKLRKDQMYHLKIDANGTVKLERRQKKARRAR